MKVKAILSIILAVMLTVLVLPAGAAADAPPTTYSAQGGGIIYDHLNGHKVAFGFNATADVLGNIDGELQAVDTQDNIVVHGSLNWAGLGGIDPDAGIGWLWGFGTCTVNGIDGFTLELSFWDSREKGASNADWIIVRVYDGSSLIYDWWNELEAGNIIVQKPKRA